MLWIHNIHLISNNCSAMAGALALLFPVLIFVFLAQPHVGYTIGFSFPSFGNNNSNQLIYMGNASFSPSKGYIDLSPSPNGTSTDQYLQLQNRTGRVLYRQPITLWPATFTTTFTMLVRKINSPVGQKNFNGDGLAFIIVPNNKTFLTDRTGQVLGLLNQPTDGNMTNQLAIEFEFDKADNHVGIDVKSIKSDEDCMGEHGIDIISGQPIRVRIHYDGWNKALQIYAAYADPSIPYASILNQTIELSSTVPQSSYIGFSATTGSSYAIQRILNWNFSSVSLPKSSLNMAPASAPMSSRESTSRALKVGLIVGSITVGVVLSGLSVWFVAKIMKSRRAAEPISDRGLSRELAIVEGLSAGSHYGPHRFSCKRLSAATKNFSETELLGTGGFGSVYKGTLEGQDEAAALVAVKRISAGSRQGEREFMSEISTIGRLRHRNLVKLQGWCHESDELMLVYDYMTNGSLDKVIFMQPRDEHQNQPPLNWTRRHRVLCGLASALLYLHEEWEQRIVHRDVKPSNVMLDEDFNARLGDFGLARLIEHDETSPAVTTKLAGTPGYWAPECAYTGKATAESDVFSFGVVVLEVASGRQVLQRRPQFEEENLMDFIWDLYGQGRVMEASDPRLIGDFDEFQMKRALILGLACSHPDPQLRPSIRQALQILINPDEQLMPLSSSRPLAIYVALPPLAPLNSQSISSYANDVGRAGSSSNNGIVSMQNPP